MFGNLLGDLQQKQAAMQEKLASITVEAEAGDEAVRVTAGADMRIANIKIDTAKIDTSDPEALEDLLLVAVNRALEAAKARAAVETNNLLKDMLPMGGLGDMFKP
jgi:DNA-binding YbaB/EbfC family protein